MFLRSQMSLGFPGSSSLRSHYHGELVRRLSLLSLLLLLSGSALAGSVAYTYDTLGRVTQIKYSNNVTIKYVYDAAGNRTSQVTTGAP